MNTVESFVLSYLLNSLWQVPLLFAAGWLAARVLRAAGAAAEHRVWVGVLLLQGLLPAFSELPLNRLGTLLSWFAPTDPDAAPRVTVDLGPGFGMGGLHLPAVLFATLALLYGSVCVYFVARFLWRCFQLHRMQREADPVTLTGHAQLSLNQCLQRFGLSAVTLAASARVFSPVTLGVTRQLVLLPASMFDGLSEADFHTVLAHELAHIRRNDFLKNLLYEVLSLPATYHPLFWLVRHHMSETREMICDQMAADLVGRHAYAH